MLYSTLSSPTLTVAHNGPATLKFTHRYNFEPDWDGGAVFVTVNGSGPTYVSGSAFTTNGYDRAVAGSSVWTGGEQVFNGQSAGWDTSTLIQSVANLGTLNAGDTVIVDFKGGWDEGFFEPDPNWEIGTVEVRDGANAAMLEVAFTNGPAGFTVTSDAGLAGPWTYRNNATCQFELNRSVSPNADRFVPDIAGATTVIDLSNAKLSVVVLAGTLQAGDTFTLFGLTGGTTLQGNYQNLSLPNGFWDLSGIQPGGNGSITLLRPVPGTLINVNVDNVARTGLVGPVGGGGGATWNQSSAKTLNGLVDSFGAPTGIGYNCSLGNGPDDWPFAAEFALLRQGFYNWTGTDPANLVIKKLPSGKRFDLYIASYYPNESGSKGVFSTTNATATVGDQYNDNGGKGGNATTWVQGQNFVVFENVLPDAAGNITITVTGITDGTTTYRAMVNGFQLVDLTPITNAPAAPTNLTASVTFSQVSLSWAGMATSMGYEVKRSTTNGGPYSVIGTVAASSNGFTDTTVSYGVTYYYVVSATNSVGASANSAQLVATPILTAPSGLTAAAGDTLVRLSWPAAAGASSYYVKQSLTSGGPYTRIVNVLSTSYTNTGLINHTTYYYVVSSTNTSGIESVNSLQASATPVHPANTSVGVWYFLNSVDPASLGWTVQRNSTPTDAGIQLGTPGVQEGMMSVVRPVGMSFTNSGLEMVFQGTGDPGNNTPYTYLSMYADSGNPPRYAYGIGGANTTAAGTLDQNINVVNTGLGEQVTTVPVATNWLGYHTMALVRLDDNTCNAYCDGLFVGSRATAPALLALANLGVGANYFGGANYFPRGTIVQRVRAFTFPSGGFNASQLWTPASINGEKQIVAMEFATLGAATINETNHTISITVPYVTDLTALAPNYTFLGKSASPASGTALNFTTPKTYTVTSSNNTSQAYVVTVLNPKSTAKVMSEVFFPGLGYANPVDSSGTNLAVYVTTGTAVTALAPTYTVSPYASPDAAFPSGSTRNFTTPQTYTITAEDGSVAYYSVAVVLVTGYSGYQALVLATGPAAYWPLNELSGDTAVDIAGGHNATYSGSFVLGARGLKLNQGTGGDVAVDFSSAAGTATAPYSDSLNPAQLTVEFWVKPGNLSAAYVVALQDRTTGSRIGYAIQKNNYTSGWDFTYGTSSSGFGTISSGTPVEVGSVYYVVATHDGTTAKLYVNGVLVNSAAASYEPATAAQPGFTIGSRNSNTYVNGFMQDVAVYNRALTLQEIQTHAQNAPSNLSAAKAGGQVVLSWAPGGGGLQSASVVTGPYTNVPAATSPYTNTPAASEKFWRLKF